MKILIRVLCVLAILYVTSYILLRSLWTHRVEDNKKIEMQFPTAQGWLHGVFSPLCHLDAAISGMTFHIGPHPEDIETETATTPAATTTPTPASATSPATPATPAPATTPNPQ